MEPYFGPQCLEFVCGAASDREGRISVAPAYISYFLFLRVSKAALISPRDPQVPEVVSFISTKVAGTIVVRHPLVDRRAVGPANCCLWLILMLIWTNCLQTGEPLGCRRSSRDRFPLLGAAVVCPAKGGCDGLLLLHAPHPFLPLVGPLEEVANCPGVCREV